MNGLLVVLVRYGVGFWGEAVYWQRLEIVGILLLLGVVIGFVTSGIDMECLRLFVR